MYTNNLNEAIKLCKVHHFADDTYIFFKKKHYKNKTFDFGKKIKNNLRTKSGLLSHRTQRQSV